MSALIWHQRGLCAPPLSDRISVTGIPHLLHSFHDAAERGRDRLKVGANDVRLGVIETETVDQAFCGDIGVGRTGPLEMRQHRQPLASWRDGRGLHVHERIGAPAEQPPHGGLLRAQGVAQPFQSDSAA